MFNYIMFIVFVVAFTERAVKIEIRSQYQLSYDTIKILLLTMCIDIVYRLSFIFVRYNIQ